VELQPRGVRFIGQVFTIVENRNITPFPNLMIPKDRTTTNRQDSSGNRSSKGYAEVMILSGRLSNSKPEVSLCRKCRRKDQKYRGVPDPISRRKRNER
jgi:hypothetical protein